MKKTISFFDLEFVALFGVLLPLVTLGVETLWHLSGSVYVDPIPSWWHFLAIAFVAVSNFVVCVKLIKGEADTPWIPFAIGAAIGVSVFYAVVFAPVAPVACVMILGFGFGFLPLAPLFAFVCAVRLAFIAGRRRRELHVPIGMGGLWRGVAVGILYLVAAEAPNFFTDMGLRQAANTSPEVSRAGIRMLRTFGNEQSVLRSCYEHMASVSDIPTLLAHGFHFADSWESTSHNLTIEEARQIYYRVYGRSFNSAPRPTFSVGLQARNEEAQDDWWGSWDSEVAGENVGGRSAGVSLAESTIAASVRPDEATSYSEWTMKFVNRNWMQQEARMQLELPPGGVVSRATLWVNGRERDAAFGERKLVRQAYQAVVASKRDPLLVTQVGPNRVMVQCFPVPPLKDDVPGEIKIRIGITAPLVVPKLDEADLKLPRFAEHGFPLAAATTVRVGCPTDFKLDEAANLIRAKRDAAKTVSYAQMPLSRGKSFISSTVRPAQLNAAKKLFVVVDGGGAMRAHLDDVAEALHSLPKDAVCEVVLATDDDTVLRTGNTLSVDKAAEALMGAGCSGGPDNMHALADVWGKALASPGSAVIWIHGPQPVLYGGEQLAQSFKPGPTLYDIEMIPSPNRLIEKLSPAVEVVEVPRLGTFHDDMLAFVHGTFGAGPAPYVVASNMVGGSLPAGAQVTVMPAVSSQLVSLWAYSQTRKLLADGKDADAVKLASRQGLVTPVTGAVVLEKDADYAKHGIDKNNPDNNAKASAEPVHIGAAPEPEEYALMAVALLVVMWQVLCRRRLRLQQA